MNKSVRIFCMSFDIISRYAFHRVTAPVCTNVRENLSAVREQFHEQHAKPVQNVVLGRQNIRFSRTVPIEGSIQQCLREIAVRIEIRPLTLALESGCNRIVAYHLFFTAFRQILVAVHQVFDDNHHLNDKFPCLFFFFIGSLHEIRIFVISFLAFFLRPFKRLLIFGFVINFFRHAADNFHFIYGFHTHAQIFFYKRRVDNGTADSHCHGTNLQIGFSSHGCSRNSRAAEPQQFFSHIVGNGCIVHILNFMSVNTECRKSLLCMRSQYGSKIYRTRTLRSVKAPYSFNRHRVHIHRLRTIAPAGCYGQCDVNAFFSEFCGTGCRFSDTSDGRICNYDFHRFAV